MEIETTYDFVHSIQVQLSPKEFEGIKEKLMVVPSIHRAAFWHLVSAGNSANTALNNCKNLYEFVRNNFIDFENAINLIRCKKRTVIPI